MYKITLHDQNCSPICDGTTFWFVENLEEFEKKWLPLHAKHGVKSIERYYKSKFGEIITDYHSKDPSLNIVQTAESKVLQEKVIRYTNKKVELINTYNCSTTVLFDQLTIRLLVLQYDNEYYLVGKYNGQGCKRLEEHGCNRWYKTKIKYSQMGFYGNPIAEYTERDINWDNWGKSDAYKDFYTNDPNFYKHESIEAFVWLPIKKVDSNYKIGKLEPKDLSTLLRDIVGEAG